MDCLRKSSPIEADGWRQNWVNGDCLRKSKFRTKWLPFIDIDEFLWSPLQPTLPEVLERYKRFSGVAVRWVLFGSSGHINKPQGGCIENYKYCLLEEVEQPSSKELPQSAPPNGKSGRVTGGTYHGKTIVNPRRIRRTGIHLPQEYFGNIVDEKFNFWRQGGGVHEEAEFWRNTTADTLRINHYWSRSLSELKDKVIKKSTKNFGPKGPKPDVEHSLQLHILRDKELNQKSNTEILPLWLEAKKSRGDLGLDE